MALSKKLLMTLFAFLAIQSISHATDTVIISNCEMVKVEASQLLMDEQGQYIISLETNERIPIHGFINQNDHIYAFIYSSPTLVRALCDHSYGCKKCGGCIQEGCWNYCAGCK